MNNTLSQHTQHIHHHERRALGEYAEQNGKDGAGLVNVFFKGLEAFDLRLFEAGRFSRPIADGTDEVLDGAIAALDRSVCFLFLFNNFSVTHILPCRGRHRRSARRRHEGPGHVHDCFRFQKIQIRLRRTDEVLDVAIAALDRCCLWHVGVLAIWTRRRSRTWSSHN